MNDTEPKAMDARAWQPYRCCRRHSHGGTGLGSRHSLRRTFTGHGAVRRIARTAGVNPVTVSNWYYGRTPMGGPHFVTLMAAGSEFERDVMTIITARRTARENASGGLRG